MSEGRNGNFESDGDKITGIVKIWKHTYGFITPDDSSLDDMFIHQNQIEPWRKGFKELVVGQKVTFSYIENKKGYNAINLEVERGVVDRKIFGNGKK